MSVFKSKEYRTKKENFIREYKRITRRELTQDTELLADYKKSVQKTYNKLTAYFAECHRKLNDLEEKKSIISKHETFLDKLKTCLDILSITYNFENRILPLIRIDRSNESVVDETFSEESEESEVEEENSNGEDFFNFESEEEEEEVEVGNKESITAAQRQQQIQSSGILKSDDLSNTNINSDLNKDKHSTNNEFDSDSSFDSIPNELNSTAKMTQTAKDFMVLANNTIGSKFDGDPLKLDSFVDSVVLLDECCEAENKPRLLKFVLTRLEGKAREIIPDDAANATDIINALKGEIKHEPSKVVEGRILALRAERNNLSKFAEKAEELADQFRRSLCSEGFTKQKAKEFAIEKTIEMCRKSTKNDTIKAILSASKFEEPKEVIAKMIVEISNSKQERLEAQSQRQFQNNRGGRGGSNSTRGNGHRNDNSNRGGSSNNSYRNNFNNNSNANNHNRSNSYGNGYNNNHRGNNNNHRNNNRNNSNVHTIRIVSGNENVSQAERHDIPL